MKYAEQICERVFGEFVQSTDLIFPLIYTDIRKISGLHQLDMCNRGRWWGWPKGIHVDRTSR